MKWEFLSDKKHKNINTKIIIKTLLIIRDIKTKSQINNFMFPKHPKDLSLKELGINIKNVDKAISRIKLSKKNKEQVIVFGDYDADGVTATAILWENLYSLGINVLPFIPNRFTEGYGLSIKTVKKLIKKYPNIKLIITVDNGIVADDAIKFAKKNKIDVIITDHHKKKKSLPPAYSIIHTTKICGAGIAWILANEIIKKTNKNSVTGLELGAIGTIADMMSLINENRSFAKHGLQEINKTTRPGLVALMGEAQLTKGSVEAYEIGFIIGPWINSAGRMNDAIESLRLLCTKNVINADKLAKEIGKTNQSRQKIVGETIMLVIKHAEDAGSEGVLVVTGENYHEGVIGLAASSLVAKYYRPVIVMSVKNNIAKASARSIAGFNIIEAIQSLDDLIIEGGGHPMAAGFSIKKTNINKFIKKINEIAVPKLTKELLTKSLKIDMKLDFDLITWDLVEELKKFNPTGMGNPTPLFATNAVTVIDARSVGTDNKHLKLKLKSKNKEFDAIAFGFGNMLQDIASSNEINIAYNLEENVWNGNRSIQLKIKDIILHEKL